MPIPALQQLQDLKGLLFSRSEIDRFMDKIF